MQMIFYISLFMSALFSLQVSLPTSVHASSERDFDQWLGQIKELALKSGISKKTVETAFNGVKVNKTVWTLDQNQNPSPKRKYDEIISRWLDIRIKKGDPKWNRIEKGHHMLKEHQKLFQKVESFYKVPKEIIASLWGTETQYGGYMGEFSVIQALTSLAFEGRREKYFTRELINALRILDSGSITKDEMIGSWAGAMGQCQFMPTNYLKLAVDFDNDGKRDIWRSHADILASIAHYLKEVHWKPDVPWGEFVSVPKNLHKWIDSKEKKSSSEWKKLGVQKVDGTSLKKNNHMARLISLDLEGAPIILAYDNFDAILR